jgi:DNA-3-methyladenine glycosylase I
MDTCPWAQSHPLLQEYHDYEWGNPVHDDRKHFEFLVMDLFQAGLSWLIILKKREGFRNAFDNFDFNRVARYDETKIQALLNDERIIRNQLKVRATVHNARRFLEVIEEFGSFDDYIWQFTSYATIQNAHSSQDELPASTKESDAMSRDLKNRGFKFVGTTICYAYMQATGMVNDHITGCSRYPELNP